MKRCWGILLAACGCAEPALPLTITTVDLPNASVGLSYTVTLRARGGSDDRQWSLVTGRAPGLTLTDDGVLRGVPVEAGTFPLLVAVSDAESARAQRALVLDVGPDARPLEILTAQLPEAVAGEPYRAVLRARGGAAPYRWSLATGAVASGLTLQQGVEEATIQGVPFEVGTYAFTVQVEDAAAGDVQARLSLEVTAAGLTILTRLVPGGEVDVDYDVPIVGAFGAQGGTGFRWSAVGLPPGLTIDEEGAPATRVSGRPTTLGTYSSTVTLQQSDASTSATLTFRIIEKRPLEIVAMALPDAMTCRPYEAAVTAIRGVGAVTFSLSGTLPDGLNLAPDGRITGRTDEVGGFTFFVEARDEDGGLAREEFGITVLPTLPTPRRYAAVYGEVLAAGRAEIAVVDLCTDDPPQRPHPSSALAAVSVFDGAISFSPDGQWLAYVGDFDNDTAEDLYVAEMFETGPGVPLNITLLDPGGSVTGVVWAPDSGALVYTSDELVPGLQELYRLDMVTFNQVHINEAFINMMGRVPNDPVRFSPDSTRLLHRGDTIVDEQFQLFYVDLSQPIPSGVNVNQQLVAGGDVFNSYRFTPDGAGLIYAADDNVDEEYNLFFVDLSVEPPTFPDLINLRNFPDADAQRFEIAPDGAFVAYLGDTVVADRNDLRVATLGGGPGAPVAAHSSVAATADCTELDWSPDGRFLAAVCDLDVDDTYELFLSDRTSGFPSVPIRVSGTMVPGGDLRQTPGSIWFSPDSRWLAYVADQDVDDAEDLYLVDLQPAQLGPAVRLTDARVAGDGTIDAFFSADSARLTIRGRYGGAGVELWAVDLPNPAAAVRLTPALPSGASGVEPSEPVVYGRDGRSLFFLGDLQTAGLVEAWHLLQPSGTLRRLNPPLPGAGSVQGLLLP